VKKRLQKEVKVKKLRTHIIAVPIFCSVLAAGWLVLFPGLVLDAFAMTGGPPGLRNSKVVLPTFNKDTTAPCVNSDDFPTQDQLSPPTFENGRAHYRTLTVNNGGSQCDHLKWKIHDTVPEAATTPCLFLLHLPGVTSQTGIKLDFLDFKGNLIKSQSQGKAPSDFRFLAQGVHVVRANLSQNAPGTRIDVGGVLFVDCSNDPGVH
jgi:hypothetical protein